MALDIKNWWDTQSSDRQRNLTVVAGLVSLVLIFWMVSGKKEKEVVETISPVQVDLLGDDQGAGDMRQFAADIKVLKDERAQDRRTIEQQARRIQTLQNTVSAVTNIADNPEQLGALVDEINRLKEDVQQLNENGRGTGSNGVAPPVLVLGGSENDSTTPPTPAGAADLSNPFSDVTGADAGPIAKYDPLAQIKGAIDGGSNSKTDGTGSRFGVLKDSSFERPPAKIVIDEPEARQKVANRSGGSRPGQSTRDKRGEDLSGESSPTIYLPSGSLFEGVLLNGMDAPTGSNSSREPYPVTIRVTSLAWLPNRYTTNVRECFILAAGFGRLDSERVHLRTESMSCILTDSTVIDVNIAGYVTGEDGKVGLRGVLVERTGALLMRAALAGFGAGMAQALEPRQINSVRTGDDAGGVEFDAPPIDEVLEVGVYKGASVAMEKLSDFYLERADQIFPIIEIDAMRRVTVHLSAGVSLQLTENAEYGSLAKNESTR